MIIAHGQLQWGLPSSPSQRAQCFSSSLPSLLWWAIALSLGCLAPSCCCPIAGALPNTAKSWQIRPAVAFVFFPFPSPRLSPCFTLSENSVALPRFPSVPFRSAFIHPRCISPFYRDGKVRRPQRLLIPPCGYCSSCSWGELLQRGGPRHCRDRAWHGHR